ncbi:MAG: M23 family metallopeptidase [Candidatus Moranbacteria bacterium]|nr:M23 family metallopeptidase [Candidatus Moranbacteria bacterium]
MAYRITPNLIFPIGNFKNISSGFGEMNVYDKTLWGKHLGIDISVPHDTKVFSAGRGVVVYSRLHPGEFSEDGQVEKRNWGGIVIIAHKKPKSKEIFYSLYGHLGKRYVKRGDTIEMGGIIGTIGKAMSESNGAWEEEHLHFGIYTGPYHGKVLPGYYKENGLTETEYWKEPVSFIKNYNAKNTLI